MLAVTIPTTLSPSLHTNDVISHLDSDSPTSLVIGGGGADLRTRTLRPALALGGVTQMHRPPRGHVTWLGRGATA